MPVFPIFLDLAGRACLVVGAGAVGVGKARRLLEAGAEVLLIDPSPTDAAVELISTSAQARLERRAFRDDDCRGRALVFACTADGEVDAAVERACERAGAICCRADGNGPVSSGAMLRRGRLCVAVSSGGASPALAAEARDRIAHAVGGEFAVAAELLAGLRSRLQDEIPDAAVRREALAPGLVRAVLDELGAGREEAARAAVENALEKARAGSGAQEQPCTR